ncbi:MAG: hypothetical protein ACP5LD_10580 [Desulfomonilaceae bacterium]
MDGYGENIVLEHQERIARLEQAQLDYDRRLESVERMFDSLQKKIDKIYLWQITILGAILSTVVGGIILSYVRAKPS